MANDFDEINLNDLPDQENVKNENQPEFDGIDLSELPDQQDQTLKSALYLANRSNPETKAQAFSLAKKMSLPSDSIDFVERNYNDLKLKSDDSIVDFDTMIRKFPKTSSFLSNPVNASIAKDDHKALTSAEDRFKDYGFFDEWYDRVSVGLADLHSNIAKIPGALGEESLIFSNATRKSFGLDQISVPKEWINNDTAKLYAKLAEETRKKYQDLDGSIYDELFENGDIPKAARLAFMQFTESLPTTAFVMVAGTGAFLAGTGAAVAAGVGGVAAGLLTMAQSLGETIERPEVEPLAGQISAVSKGAMEGLFEQLQVLGPLKHWDKALERSGKAILRREFWKEFGKAWFYSGATEGTTEALTQAGQDFSDYMTGVNPDLTFTETVQNMFNAGVIGAVGGLSTTSVQTSLMAYQRQQLVRQTALARDFYLAIGEDAKASLARERLPEFWQEHVDGIVEEGKVKDIYIDVEDFKTYAQNQNIDPTKLAQELGIVDELSKAEETDSSISVPLSKWTAEAITTEHYVGLSNDIRVREEGLSYNQAKKQADETRAEIEKEKAEVEKQESLKSVKAKEAREIGTQIETQLVGAGFKKEEAKTVAKVQESFFRAFIGERAKKSVKEFFNKYNLTYSRGDETVDLKPGMIEKEEVPDVDTKTFFQKINNQTKLGFYSQVENEVTKMDFKSIPPKDLVNRIKNIPGVKSEEIESLGLVEWLNSQENKVSKEEVLSFINDNIIKVDQVVLGAGGVGESFNFSEPEFIAYSDYDQYGFNDSVETEAQHYLNDDEYFAKDNTERFRKEFENDYTDENGIIDEEGLNKRIQSELEKLAYKLAEEYVDSEDYSGAHYRIIEKNSGLSIVGNDEIGYWYSEDLDKHFEGNSQEAMIKFSQALIEAGEIEAKSSDILTADKVAFNNRVYSAKSISDKTINKKAKDLFVKEKDRFIKKAEERYKSSYDLSEKTPEELQKEKESDALQEAFDEIEESYKDPENPKNKVKVDIDYSPIFSGYIEGNNKKGYIFVIDGKSVSVEGGGKYKATNEYKLEAKSIEGAKNEAIQKLVDLKIISPERKAEDINAPTGKTKWSRYTVPGGENYREILLTLPDLKGEKFTYKTHFEQENILAHVRLTDRTDSNGRNVLFIEEMQSDWHQQGRERGYKSKDLLQKNFRDWLKENGHDLSEEEIKSNFNNEESDLFKKYREEQDAAFENANAVPDAPFKNTEAWSSLALKRIIRLATEQGYDAVAWTPSNVHVERWGTDRITWVKNENYGVYDGETLLKSFPTEEQANSYLEALTVKNKSPWQFKEANIKKGEQFFLVGSVEISGGIAGGINIEELARQRGELLERRGEKVTTKEELASVMTSTLGRERGDRSLNSLIDSTWKKMQSEITGKREPRKEGMEFYYDNVLPKKVAPGILRKIDKEAKVEVTKIKTSDEPLDSWEIVLTDKMKNVIKEQGFSLFQKDEAGPRGLIKIGNQSMDIKLFSKADVTTPIHEFAHFSLEVMGDLSEDVDVPQEVKDDYQKVLNFLGVENKSQIQTEQHEKFADAMETYFLEGKSPSEGLRAVFNRLKDWFQSIYEYVKGGEGVHGVKLNAEIREVFDRMFATEAEILKNMPKPMFPDPAAVGMNPSQVAGYLKAQEEATMFAKDTLREKISKDLKRKQRAEYKARKQILVNEWTERANQEPVYMLLSVLQTGVMPDGTEISPEMKGIKLDKEALIFEFGEGILKVLPKDTYEENGVYHGIMAEAFGFKSPTDMIDKLSSSLSKKDYIDTNVNAQLELEFPPIDPQKISSDVIDSVYNEKLMDMKQLELEYLMTNNPNLVKTITKKVVARPLNKQYIFQQAEKIINDTLMSQVKPHLYDRAARASAKKAGELLAKGDIAGAFEAKRKEQLNIALYKKSMEALKTRESVKETVKKFLKKDADLAKTRDIDLIDAGRKIIVHYNLSSVKSLKEDPLANLRTYDPDLYEHVNGLVNGVIKTGKTFEQLTFAEFFDIDTALKALWAMSKAEKQITIEGKKVDLYEAIREMDSRVAELNIDPKEYKRKRKETYLEEKATTLLEMNAALTRVEAWVESLDKDFFGPFRKYIWNPVNDAITKYRDEKNKVFQRYEKEILSKYRDLFDKKKDIDAYEIGEKFNPTELIMVILHSGNLSNKDKLIRGHKWGTVDELTGETSFSNFDAFMNRAMKEGIITERHMDLAQEIWDLLESFKADTQRAHKEIYGHYFDEISANEIQTPWGKTYRGGYIPAIADPLQDDQVAIRKAKNELEETSIATAFPSTGRGATMKRVQAYAAPLSLSMNILSAHIDWALRFSHVQPAIKDVSKLVMNKEFRESIKLIDENAVKEILLPWLQRAATQKVMSPDRFRFIDKIARNLINSASMQIMVGNFANGLQQLTGIFPAMVKIGPKYALKGIRQFVLNPVETNKIINELSPWMRSTANSSFYETQNAISEIVVEKDLRSRFKNFQEIAKKYGYIFSQAFQGFVNNSAWIGAFNQKIEEGYNQEQAVKYADSVIRLTQGAATAENISNFETGSPSALLFKQFVSYFNMLYNLQSSQYKKIMRDSATPYKAPQLVYVYALAHAMPAILSDFIFKAVGRGYSSDDDEEFTDQVIDTLFFSQIRTVVAMLPYGQAANVIFNGFNDARYDDRINMSPGLQMAESLFQTPGILYKKTAGEEEFTEQDYRTFANGIGYLLGLPINPIYRRAEYIYKALDQQLEVETTPLEVTRGILTGKEQKQ